MLHIKILFSNATDATVKNKLRAREGRKYGKLYRESSEQKCWTLLNGKAERS